MTSVITTINYPTEAVKKLASITNLIVVGDKKTPESWSNDKHDFDYMFISDGYFDRFSIEEFLPFNHYARKNLGYLAAIANGSQIIYDTDDDNIPNENWNYRTIEVAANESEGTGWYNVYYLLTNEFIWPRGFSLQHVSNVTLAGEIQLHNSSIQQGLSNGEPDVDAIWRMVRNHSNFFGVKKSVYLKPGAWCPFNSQSTWWFPKAYPLMYLPVTASFRMTDIWRSFVAQRCLWEIGEGVTFHSPAEVYQDRNEHDLLKDFEDEIPGYLLNDKIVNILSGLSLNGDVFGNMYDCYAALVDKEIIPFSELNSLTAWFQDVEKVWKP